MKYKVVFTPSAESTYEAIKIQLTKNWNLSVVKDFEKRIDKHLMLMCLNPMIYPLIHQKLQGRRCLVHPNCSILFTIKNSDVVILSFWDNRQEPIF